MKGLCTLLVLFILAVGILLIYIKFHAVDGFVVSTGIKLPHIETPPVRFTYNIDSKQIVKILDNIMVDGRYLNVYQCKPLVTTTVKGEEVYSPLGQYIKITDTVMTGELEDSEKKFHVLTLLASGGVMPMDYVLVWSSEYLAKQPKQDFSIWRPIAPNGYKSLCDVCVMGFSKPTVVTSKVVCLPVTLLENSPVLKDVMLSIDYEAFNMDFSLHCWNVSSHQFFRCASSTSSNMEDTSKTPSPSQILPLVMSENNIKNDIYNVKNENLLMGGSNSMPTVTPTANPMTSKITRYQMST